MWQIMQCDVKQSKLNIEQQQANHYHDSVVGDAYAVWAGSEHSTSDSDVYDPTPNKATITLVAFLCSLFNGWHVSLHPGRSTQLK